MLLTERYRDKIQGVISCYDRIIIQGTLPNLCYAQGMTAFLTKRGIRIFDYPRFAEPLRDALRVTTALGLRMAFDGDGVVVSQTPAPNSPVDPATRGTLWLQRRPNEGGSDR